MGKASSAKKIARAQRAGATTGPTERRALGFPALVIGIIVVGLLLVGWARSSRDAQVTPTLQDHWHDAYGVWDCVSQTFLPPFQSQVDPVGIHSHTDGLIHVHPFTSAVTGKGAVMGIFFDAMGVTVTKDGIDLPGGQSLEAGAECDGAPSVIQIARWSDVLAGGAPDEIITDNFDKVRFRAEGEGFTIARAPVGADIPVPDTLDALRAVLGQSRSEGVEPPTDSEVVPPQDFGVGTPTPAETATAEPTAAPDATPTPETGTDG